MFSDYLGMSHGRVNNAKPELLHRMAETGCVWIGYGIESGSQKILHTMNKKTIFIIGAFSELHADGILTRDYGYYKTYFSKLNRL